MNEATTLETLKARIVSLENENATLKTQLARFESVGFFYYHDYGGYEQTSYESLFEWEDSMRWCFENCNPDDYSTIPPTELFMVKE